MNDICHRNIKDLCESRSQLVRICIMVDLEHNIYEQLVMIAASLETCNRVNEFNEGVLHIAYKY